LRQIVRVMAPVLLAVGTIIATLPFIAGVSTESVECTSPVREAFRFGPERPTNEEFGRALRLEDPSAERRAITEKVDRYLEWSLGQGACVPTARLRLGLAAIPWSLAPRLSSGC